MDNDMMDLEETSLRLVCKKTGIMIPCKPADTRDDACLLEKVFDMTHLSHEIFLCDIQGYI